MRKNRHIWEMVVLVEVLFISAQHLEVKYQQVRRHHQAEVAVAVAVAKFLYGLQQIGEVPLHEQGSVILASSLAATEERQVTTAVGVRVEIGVVLIPRVIPMRPRKH